MDKWDTLYRTADGTVLYVAEDGWKRSCSGPNTFHQTKEPSGSLINVYIDAFLKLFAVLIVILFYLIQYVLISRVRKPR